MGTRFVFWQARKSNEATGATPCAPAALPRRHGVADPTRLCADGGAPRRPAAGRFRLALRTEVGRISLPRLSRWERGRLALEIPPAAGAVFPRHCREGREAWPQAIR